MKRGDWVMKTRGDYTFIGRVVAIFEKLDSDAERIVVQDRRGLLLIMNPEQLLPASKAAALSGKEE